MRRSAERGAAVADWLPRGGLSTRGGSRVRLRHVGRQRTLGRVAASGQSRQATVENCSGFRSSGRCSVRSHRRQRGRRCRGRRSSWQHWRAKSWSEVDGAMPISKARGWALLQCHAGACSRARRQQPTRGGGGSQRPGPAGSSRVLFMLGVDHVDDREASERDDRVRCQCSGVMTGTCQGAHLWSLRPRHSFRACQCPSRTRRRGKPDCGCSPPRVRCPHGRGCNLFYERVVDRSLTSAWRASERNARGR